MDNFILILIYLSLGFAMRRVPKFPSETPVVLNTFVMYVALPALVLQKIPSLHFSWDLLIPALVPWILLLIVSALIVTLGRLLRWSRDIIVALLIVLPLGNTSFLGFPMIEALFGGDWLPYAMIYDQIGSFVALATWSTILAALYGVNAAQSKVSPTAMAIRILTFPPFLALIVGLSLKAWTYPPLLQTTLDNLAVTLVPLIMFAVGFQLKFSLAGERLSPLLSGLGIKLLLMPLLVLCGAMLLGLSGKAVQVSVFEAAMPPMISAGAIAMMAGLAPRLVAALVGFGLLLSFITLPLWAWLLHQI
ncbi:AEC family transporter [Rheinheimera texasensis]|uniref:AEC family transporter n=1 Tax=Rheinheimera texasensis TaxID=306205 RepID=UPI0032B1AA67